MPNSKFQITNGKIALAHDSFTQMGGAERVVEALHELFPQAPVFTTVFDEKYRKMYPKWDIRTSWLQKVYIIFPKFKYLLPLIPWAVDSIVVAPFMGPSDADKSARYILLSSSSGFVKNIKPPAGCIHINYCHTPTRFLWIDKDYINQEVPFPLRSLVKFFLVWMKKWDYAGAQRVTYFIANSLEVQKRIQSVYHRTSTVVHAGVDTNFWKPTKNKSNYFLLAGRLQAHKHNDLIIQVFNDLKIPLHLIGTGRQEQYLKSIAEPNIKFFGLVSDEQLRDEYSGALGFLYPQVEDFGLMPLEAAACGTATLAFAQGGALETVVPGVTGELFGQPNNPSPLARGDVSKGQRGRNQGLFLGHLISNSSPQGEEGLPIGNKSDVSNFKEQIKQLILNWNLQKYKIDALRAQAEKFSQEKFKQQILEFIHNLK